MQTVGFIIIDQVSTSAKFVYHFLILVLSPDMLREVNQMCNQFFFFFCKVLVGSEERRVMLGWKNGYTNGGNDCVRHFSDHCDIWMVSNHCDICN